MEDARSTPRRLLETVVDVLPRASPSTGEEIELDSIEGPWEPVRDQILQLLADRGGYEWQGELAARLECSESKTSRVLSEMQEDGRITRHRIGRRKIVCLPNREPEQLKRRQSSHPGANA